MSKLQRRSHYGVGVYIVRNRRVLLMWHEGVDQWVPCGGRILLDHREYPHEAACRKAREEVGLTIELHDEDELAIEDELVHSMPRPAAIQEITPDNTDSFLDFVYFAVALAGDVSLNVHEARGFHWFSIDDLRQFPLRRHIAAYAEQALKECID